MTRGRGHLPTRLLPWLAVVLAALVAVLGIGVARSGGRHPTHLVETVGGTAVMDVTSVPTNLNPHTVAGNTSETNAVATLLWPQTYLTGPGLSPQLDTELLASAEVVSVSPQTVVYHINPAARWSDGTSIRSDAFVYLWHEEIEPDAMASVAARNVLPQRRTAVTSSGAATGGHAVTGSGAATGGHSVATALGYRDIASVTGSNGGTTVTVVFRTPYADWADLFDSLLPPAATAKAGWSLGFDRLDQATEVSGGPWVVASWQPGRRLVLVHNPLWWGPKPKLRRLVLQATPSTTTMVGNLDTGAAQLAAPGGYGLGTLTAVSSSPTLRSASSLGTTMLQLDYNTTQAPLQSTAVRQALSHLIDRTKLVTQLVQPLEPLAWVDDNFLFPNSQSGYRDDGQDYLGTDPSEAAQLLAGAGIVPDSQGVEELAGAPVTLTLVWAAGDPWSAMVGPVIAADLQAAGFDVASDPVAGSSVTAAVAPGGAWDLAVVPVPGQAYTSLLAPAYSTTFGTYGADGVQDLSGFDSAAVDAEFHRALSQLFAVTAASDYHQIDTELWTAMPALPLFAEPTLAAWSASIAGAEGDDGGAGLLWNAEHLAFVRRPGQATTFAASPAHH